jgi:hypothetical protein
MCYIHKLITAGGLFIAGAFIAGAVVTSGEPAFGSVAASQPQCSVSVHFRVSASGKETTRVSGQCNGHAPTAGQVARLAAPLVTRPGIRHHSPKFCRDALGVRERFGCWAYTGSNTTVIFDPHGRVTTS